MNQADLERSLARYRELAPRYDHYTRRIDGIRRRAIEALQLRAGDTVLDVACGTGWCIPMLAERVGPLGRVIAFDASAEMLDQARARPAAARVELICAQGVDVRLPVRVDAILFSYTHDLIRSPEAITHLLAQAQPGARVAATSTKLYAPLLFPANWYLRWSHRAYITDFEGFEAPWSLLAERLEGFRVETGPFTQHYVASGRVPANQAA
jgi:SAM-dependent methyltransferase